MKIRIVTTGIMMVEAEVPDDFDKDPWELADSCTRSMQDALGWDEVKGNTSVAAPLVTSHVVIDGVVIAR